ncbi:hypothetical protein ACVOMV_12680 [Mesorhizobium atlanticum]
MEEIGISPPFIVGQVLNHVSATKSTVTSRVYARYDYMSEKRDALELWADRLAGIIAGKGNIEPLQSEGRAGNRSGANLSDARIRGFEVGRPLHRETHYRR